MDEQLKVAPRVGHMEPFRRERGDWEKVYQFLRDLRPLQGLMSSDWATVCELSHRYATRQYPDYQMHAFPTSFQAVDNVIINRHDGRILLVRKPKEALWRFCGGFVDPTDTSLEVGAFREFQEECDSKFKVTIDYPPTYLGSFRVPDPRYEHSPDKIMSAVMLFWYRSGIPCAGDDIKWVKWVTKDYLRRNYKKIIMPLHQPIVELLIHKGYL